MICATVLYTSVRAHKASLIEGGTASERRLRSAAVNSTLTKETECMSP